MHAGPLGVRTWSAIGHLVVQSFFHQPLRSFSLCVLPAHVRQELSVHVRSCFLLSRSMCLAVARHCLAMPKRDPYNKLSADEIRLAKMRRDEDGMAPSEIAELLRRDKSSMTRLLVMQKAGVGNVRTGVCSGISGR